MKLLQFSYDTDFKAGDIVKDMPNKLYHAHNSISKSGLDLIARSPAHYLYREPSTNTRFMQIGTAIHCAILEPDRFKDEYILLIDANDRRSPEYQAAKKEHGEEFVLVSHEVENVLGMQASVYANPVAKKWLDLPSEKELSIFAKDPETGVTVRIRPDILTACGSIVDLKKTQDARPREFSKSIYNYRYHVQVAFYLDVYKWVTGDECQSFRFLAVEEKRPYSSMVYMLDDLAIDEGRKLYREALNVYADCLEKNQWPSYLCADDEIVSLPDWEVRRLENELLEELIF
ncbi:PD-(D/E)XK nuclease-like domain-containing protein [Oligella urethralis]|uniref:PD-(D/E)XK nuclease-like domain-containing protein n=1 Tax=Oligella urethralis TaxID=90245 RepID=UPI000DFC5570|nr:PD-(D/E)XK nuclease-like domain-containing protein [Oligella urethralis]SUA58231.1 Exodeoxyribonuclease 8 [Oligella urethralis]